MVSLGTASGQIEIFQISLDPACSKKKVCTRQSPSFFQLHCIMFHAKSLFKIHKFKLNDVHHSKITCFKWSQNAMKVISGDESGVVNCTEIDYESV